jgi:hypothetical protein
MTQEGAGRAVVPGRRVATPHVQLMQGALIHVRQIGRQPRTVCIKPRSLNSDVDLFM